MGINKTISEVMTDAVIELKEKQVAARKGVPFSEYEEDLITYVSLVLIEVAEHYLNTPPTGFVRVIIAEVEPGNKFYCKDIELADVAKLVKAYPYKPTHGYPLFHVTIMAEDDYKKIPATQGSIRFFNRTPEKESDNAQEKTTRS